MWSNPQFSIGKFNSLETNCFLNEQNTTKHEMIRQVIADSEIDEFVVNDLVSGGVYKCSVTTLRTVDGLRPESTSSLFVSSMTSKFFMTLGRLKCSLLLTEPFESI